MNKLSGILLSAIILAAIIFASCVKNTIPYIPPVDENFNWKTTDAVSITVPLDFVTAKQPADTKGGQYASTVKIYASPLYSESSLIASGAVYSGKAFQTVMDLMKGAEQVYVKIISPEGFVTLSSYDIVGNKAVKSRAGSRTVKSGNETIGEKPAVPAPAFPAAYDVTVNSASDLPQTLTDNKTYFIPQGRNITLNNAALFANWNQNNRPVLYVKGNLVMENPGSITMSFSSLVVLNGGSVTLNGRLNLGSTAQHLLAIYVQEGGKLQLKRGFDASVKGVSLVNKGDLEVKGPEGSILSGGSLFYNTGEAGFSTAAFNLSGTGSVCYNEGEMDVKGLMLDSGSEFFNYEEAELECDNTLHVNNNCVFRNAGEVESGKINIVSRASFYNYGPAGKPGKVKTDALTMTNTENYLYQHGFFTVEGTFSAKGKIDNYGKLETEVITDGSTASFYGYAGSLLKTAYLSGITNATFYMEPQSIIFIYKNGNGKGNTDNWNVKFINQNENGKDYALVIWGVSDTKPDNTIINSRGEVSFAGNIENYCPKKNDAQNKKYTDDYCEKNAFWGERQHMIPDSEYNEGLGNTGGKDPVDKDRDGVPEGEDVDDNDPTVTHVSYFPSATGWATYFFEDLWPYTGDYDMNDIVLGFRIVYYSKGELTAGNNVVYMDIDWKLRAVGSQMQLAFGIQLDDITPNMVARFENNNTALANTPINKEAGGLESGQSKAVFALFNNPSELYGVSTGINVYHDVNGATATPVEKKVRIRFTNGISKEKLLLSKINPFLVVSPGAVPERGREIHLSTNSATDKVNSAYYSQGFVSERNPYKANNGMVWGYMVPDAFRYPIEMVPVTSAYPNFAKWYQSAGMEHTNWFDTSVAGNVVEEYLYDSQWK